MYTVSDVVELGNAQELILSQLKDCFLLDDIDHLTMRLEPPW
jgi:hypothetical protein